MADKPPIQIPRAQALDWITEHSSNLNLPQEERDALLKVTQKSQYLARGICVFTNSIQCECPVVASGLRRPGPRDDWDVYGWGLKLVTFAWEWDDWTAIYGASQKKDLAEAKNTRVVELV